MQPADGLYGDARYQWKYTGGGRKERDPAWYLPYCHAAFDSGAFDRGQGSGSGKRYYGRYRADGSDPGRLQAQGDGFRCGRPCEDGPDGIPDHAAGMRWQDRTRTGAGCCVRGI